MTSIPLKLNWANGQEPIAEVFLGPKNKTHPFDLVNLFHENGLNNVEFKRSKQHTGSPQYNVQGLMRLEKGRTEAANSPNMFCYNVEILLLLLTDTIVTTKIICPF